MELEQLNKQLLSIDNDFFNTKQHHQQPAQGTIFSHQNNNCSDGSKSNNLNFY